MNKQVLRILEIANGISEIRSLCASKLPKKKRCDRAFLFFSFLFFFLLGNLG